MDNTRQQNKDTMSASDLEEESVVDVNKAMMTGASEEESVDVKEMIQLQLAEVEMLQSMFSNKGEFTLDSRSALEEVQAFVDGTLDYDALESRVGFTVRLEIQTSSSPACKVELSCHFAHDYPAVQPSVSVRAEGLSKKRHRVFSEDFYRHLFSLPRGELFIISLVGWLQENTHIYLKGDEAKCDEADQKKKSEGKKGQSFTRLWIYSHHIYSKSKRHDIMDWANELDLRGFSMPGKPGVICLEGYSDMVDEFWYRIRRLNWKQLTIKEQEVEELEGKEVASLCRFGKFQELELEVVGGNRKSYHMDLGHFYSFLLNHHSAYVFPLYFGVEGKTGGGGGGAGGD